MTHRTALVATLLATHLLLATGCETAAERRAERARVEAEVEARVASVLDRSLAAIRLRTDSLDDRLQPLPLLRPGEEAELRRFLNAAHLSRARLLGVRPLGPGALDSLVAEGRLVALEDSTRHWVVRELEHSEPWVVPATRDVLVRIGERFHARLDSLGLPPYRLEISSVLRTAEQQADLRGTNPNAAAGTSTHEYGTTVDIPYSAYAAPARPVVDPVPAEEAWLAPRVRPLVDAMTELVAARRSRELQAVLGRVLREVQAEGLVYVTLERQQPVYHVTVARAPQPGS